MTSSFSVSPEMCSARDCSHGSPASEFHQHVESKADVEPFRVLRTDKIEESNKRRRVLDAEYDHEKRKVIWREISPNPQGGTFDFSEPIQDVLTVVYYFAHAKARSGKIL